MHKEDYKEEIIRMVDEIKDKTHLFRIYHYILVKYIKECEKEKQDD